jgi:hypothetical protein
MDCYSLHPAVPFTAERGTRPHLRNRPAKALGLRGHRSIQEAPALSVKVTEAFRLELIGQHPEHEMAGKASRRWPAKDCPPTPVEFIDVEITQTRNLNVKLVLVWKRPTDSNTWHCA